MQIRHLLGIGTIAALGFIALQMSRAPSSEQASLYVFDSIESCVQLKGEAAISACQELEAEARSIASAMHWPFDSYDECVASHGAKNCYTGDDGAWRVKMGGFTRFSKNTTFRSALPVFHSTSYPGFYLPNGYPVLTGENTILEELLSMGGYLASRPRSLVQDLCVRGKGVVNCQPVHSYVHASTLTIPVVAALFSEEAGR